MNKRNDSQKADIIQIIIKPFLHIGYGVMLCFGSVYYLSYALSCKIAKLENKYVNFSGFNKVIKSIVFSNTIKNDTDKQRQRANVRKSRKQSAEYISRPSGRIYTDFRERSSPDKAAQYKEVKPKSYFFKRLFAYAGIFFMKEDIRREKSKEIDQKYPPKVKSNAVKHISDKRRTSKVNSEYPVVQNLEFKAEENTEYTAKRTLLHRKIMITSAAVIMSCVIVFVGAMAYAQELPDGFNVISPDPTINLFATMLPVEGNEYCEVLPDGEVDLYLEYPDEAEIEEDVSETAPEVNASVETESDVVMAGNITTEAKIFKLGDEDPEIANIQARLMELHYMSSADVTNYYGKNTAYAMEYFQRQHGLQVDGTTGAETLAVLYSDSAQEYTVKEGTEGADVKEIQERLYELKYLASSTYITGYYGSKTKEAVKDFQDRNGLSADGVVGYNTHKKLFSSSAIKNSTSSSSSGSSSGSTVTGSGSASDIVTVAKSLMNQGYVYVWGGKSPSDGGFDCSGFVYYVLNQAGIKTGYRDSSTWATTTSFTTIGSIDNLKPGDICVFKGHVGIYIGNMQMIHCTSWSDGSGILISSIDTNYRRENWIWGKRIVN